MIGSRLSGSAIDQSFCKVIRRMWLRSSGLLRACCRLAAGCRRSSAPRRIPCVPGTACRRTCRGRSARDRRQWPEAARVAASQRRACRACTSPSALGRHQPTYHPAAARSSQSRHHGPVSHDRHRQGVRHGQSFGHTRRHYANRAGPRARLTSGFRGPRGAGGGGCVPPLRSGFP